MVETHIKCHVAVKLYHRAAHYLCGVGVLELLMLGERHHSGNCGPSPASAPYQIHVSTS